MPKMAPRICSGKKINATAASASPIRPFKSAKPSADFLINSEYPIQQRKNTNTTTATSLASFTTLLPAESTVFVRVVVEFFETVLFKLASAVGAKPKSPIWETVNPKTKDAVNITKTLFNNFK